jgi:cytochrome P450
LGSFFPTIPARSRDVYLLSHPDHIQGVLADHHRKFVKPPGFLTIKRMLGGGLLTSEGERHLRQRRMIQLAFHQERIASYGQVMITQASCIGQRWREGETVDIFREMTRLTLAIVGETRFVADVTEAADEIGRAIGDTISLFHSATSPLELLLHKLPWIGPMRFECGRRYLDGAIYRLIRERRTDKQNHGELLSMLLCV